MDISVVTPIYKGNKYIPSILEILEENAKNAPEIKIELVLVNDYPEIALEIEEDKVRGFEVKVVENEKNLGIQAARINGINASSGEYVMMLDQDDAITKDALYKLYSNIGIKDAIISNGYYENEELENIPLYKTSKQINKVNNEQYYYYVGNLIASPGLCLIKKTAISEVWKKNIITTNGADDWLLWVLFLSEGRKFEIINEHLYIHKNVGSNCSDNNEMMLSSSEEALQIAMDNEKISKKLTKVYQRRLKMRRYYEGKQAWKKMIAYICNIDIACYLFMYKHL